MEEEAQQAVLLKGIENLLGGDDGYDRPPPSPTAEVFASPPTAGLLPLDGPGKGHDSLLPAGRHPAHLGFEGTELEAILDAGPAPAVPEYYDEPPRPGSVELPVPPPAFVSRHNTAAAQAEAARAHPKEQFFTEARRRDFRRANGLESAGDEMDVEPGYARTTRLDRPESFSPRLAGAWGSPPPLEGWVEAEEGEWEPQPYQLHPRLSLPPRHEWRHPPQGWVESPEEDPSLSLSPTHRGSLQPPPRVLTPIEFQPRPFSAYPDYPGVASSRPYGREQQRGYEEWVRMAGGGTRGGDGGAGSQMGVHGASVSGG